MGSKTNLLLLIGATLCLTSALQAEDTPFLTADMYGWQLEKEDISYGDKSYMWMDMYTPKQKGDNDPNALDLKPVLIHCHGAGGTPEKDMYITRYFAKSGYVGFSIEYGKNKPNLFNYFKGVNFDDGINPAEQTKIEKAQAAVQEWRENIAECVNHVRENWKEYGIDPNRVVLSGGSQGAYLATQTAYDEALFGDNPVNSVLSLRGGSFAGGCMNKDYAPHFTDHALDTTYDDVPIFIAHGNKDKTNLHEASVMLNEDLTNQGVTTKFITLDKCGHSARDISKNPPIYNPTTEYKNGTHQDKTNGTPFEQNLAFFYDHLDLANINVPEPSTFAFLGLTLLGACSRRRK